MSFFDGRIGGATEWLSATEVNAAVFYKSVGAMNDTFQAVWHWYQPLMSPSDFEPRT